MRIEGTIRRTRSVAVERRLRIKAAHQDGGDPRRGHLQQDDYDQQDDHRQAEQDGEHLLQLLLTLVRRRTR